MKLKEEHHKFLRFLRPYRSIFSHWWRDVLQDFTAAMNAVNVDLDEMRARVDATHSIITSRQRVEVAQSEMDAMRIEGCYGFRLSRLDSPWFQGSYFCFWGSWRGG